MQQCCTTESGVSSVAFPPPAYRAVASSWFSSVRNVHVDDFPLARRPNGPRATRSFVSVGAPLYTTHRGERLRGWRAKVTSTGNADRPLACDARCAAGLPRAARLAEDRTSPGSRRQPSLMLVAWHRWPKSTQFGWCGEFKSVAIQYLDSEKDPDGQRP